MLGFAGLVLVLHIASCSFILSTEYTLPQYWHFVQEEVGYTYDKFCELFNIRFDHHLNLKNWEFFRLRPGMATEKEKAPA